MATVTDSITANTMLIRHATDEDLPAILALYRFLQPEDPVLDSRDGRVRKQWGDVLRDERLRYFVAEAAGGAVVSCCALVIVPNLTRDEAVWVARECRDGAGFSRAGIRDGRAARGVGRRLGRGVLQGDASDGEERRGNAPVL